MTCAWFRGDADLDPVPKHTGAAFTAVRSPPDSRMTGADSPGDRRFVDRGDAFDDLAVRRNELPRLTITTSSLRRAVAGTVSVAPEAATMRLAVVFGPRFTPACRPALPPSLRHRLREVGETAR